MTRPRAQQTGLDALLDDPGALAGRRYALLAHGAAVSAALEPAHLALSRAAHPPELLFGPEHGYYGVEQDMVASRDERDPWTGAPVRSLYGDNVASLAPSPSVFADVDLVLVDLQDIGARYYTFAATAVWTARAALAAGAEVWVLDRPNPIGGSVVEGNGPRPALRSFVGAFDTPVRHGLTLGELVRLEARRERWDDRRLVVRPAPAWTRERHWPELGRPWIATSPNMPSYTTALLYPGLCLIEATTLSEGRGTTRPFRLLGAPGVDPLRLRECLAARPLDGLAFAPTYFKPQFQKHAGMVCGGVEIVVTDPLAVRPYRAGIEILRALRDAAPEAWTWRSEPYEFVTDRPAIDLLTGSTVFRRALDRGVESEIDDWIDSWSDDERAFSDERRDALLYD
jgi:uncharacterized protein YbbC (DUF1343 family)